MTSTSDAGTKHPRAVQCGHYTRAFVLSPAKTLGYWKTGIAHFDGVRASSLLKIGQAGTLEIDLDRFATIQAEMDAALARLKQTKVEAEKRLILQRLRGLLADADTLVSEPWKPSDARIPLALEVLRELLEREKPSVPAKAKAAEA